MKMRILALAACCGLGWSAPETFAHGGAYRGPGDFVPPSAPSDGGGAAGQLPLQSSASGSGDGGATVTPNSPSSSTRRRVGFGRRAPSFNYERWEFWWEYNKEPYLALEQGSRAHDVVVGSAGFLFGRAARQAAREIDPPTPELLHASVLPQLREVLDEMHQDVVDSAVLAIARTLDAREFGRALPDLRGTLDHPAQSARESATLSMGVLGAPQGSDDLIDLLLDTPRGRVLCARPNGVEDRMRAFAAASLGMVGGPRSAKLLMQVIRDSQLSSKRDLQAMAILALGLLRTERDTIVPFLLELMDDAEIDRVVRAQVPVALGRLYTRSGAEGAAATLEVVADRLLSPETELNLRRSLAICCGMIATMADGGALEALRAVAARTNDEQTHHFALMSLAQIGSRDADPASHAAAHTDLELFLKNELHHAARRSYRPYAALALAIYGRNEDVLGLRRRMTRQLLDQYALTHDPSHQGALAVSFGLLGDPLAEAVVLEMFEETKDQGLKGYAAIGLGLMRSTHHAALLRDEIQKPGLETTLRLQLARALGLMGDVQSIDPLIRLLETSQTLPESSSTAQALGLLGHRAAVEPLLEILDDTARPVQQRGFAAVALGILSEKTPLPWNVAFSVNCNYRAQVPALAEILDIL